VFPNVYINKESGLVPVFTLKVFASTVLLFIVSLAQVAALGRVIGHASQPLKAPSHLKKGIS